MRITSAVRSAFEVFSRNAKISQRNRAAQDLGKSRQSDYLRQEVANRMVERLALIARHPSRVVDFGAGSGLIEQAMCQPTQDAQAVRERFGKIIMVDGSRKLLYRDVDLEFNKELDITRVTADEETWFPGDNTVDAVISSMSMHWINDLPGALGRIERMLVPDGMFMANMIGGDSLFELRTSLQLAEMERYGRISPRLSPLADVRDLGNLLQQAGFKLLTIDVEDIVVGYPDMFALMDDLQAMGESNAVKARPQSIPPVLLQLANAIYREMHGEPDGSVPATFRVVFMMGWKHDASIQQQPKARGSAEHSFKNLK